jgi:hypothetical protein
MIKNPTIRQALANIEKSVQARAAYNKIVKAGTAAIYDKAMFQKLTADIQKSGDPVKTVSEGMIGILGLLYQKSNKTMPIPPMVLAGMALLLDALDFMEQSGLVKIDKAELNRATTMYVNSLLPKFGLTPDKLGAALGPLQGAIQDPNKLAQMRQSAGA